MRVRVTHAVVVIFVMRTNTTSEGARDHRSTDRVEVKEIKNKEYLIEVSVDDRHLLMIQKHGQKLTGVEDFIRCEIRQGHYDLLAVKDRQTHPSQRSLLSGCTLWKSGNSFFFLLRHNVFAITLLSTKHTHSPHHLGVFIQSVQLKHSTDGPTPHFSLYSVHSTEIP